MSYFPYYTINTALTVVLMVIMTVFALGNGSFEKKRTWFFASAFGAISLAAMLEWLGVYLNGAAYNTILLHKLVKAGELSIAPLIPMALGRCVDGGSRNHSLFAVACLNIALEICSVFTGWVFYVDEANIYRHGDIYAVYYLFLAIGFVSVIFSTYFANKRNQNWRASMMWLLALLLISGIVPHMINSDVRYDWLVCAITVTLYYAYSVEINALMDPLTGVFCRSVYEKRIERPINNGTVFVLFDVDEFKQINDTYGHQSGDEMLKLAARRIRRVFGRYGRCYRIGGDEFCAILEKNPLSVEMLIRSFDELIESRRALNPAVHRVSCGYGIYNGDLAQVIKMADDNMYANKRAIKNEE